MILRNGVRSTLRARGRSVLFAMLILILTLALTLGLGLYAYSSLTLAEMDQSYTSVALVEYMGRDYPEGNAADPYARSALEGLTGDIGALPGVKSWEEPDETLAALEGYVRGKGSIPYENRVVAVAESFSPMEREGWHLAEDGTIEGTVREKVAMDYRDGYLMAVFFGSDGQEQLAVPLIMSNGVSYVWSGEKENRTLRRGEFPENFVLYTGQTKGSPYQYVGPDLGWDPTEAFGSMGLMTKDGRYQVYGKYIVGYNARISDVWFSQGRCPSMVIVGCDDEDFAPQRGERYLIHGAVDQNGNSGNTVLELIDFAEGEEEPYLLLGEKGTATPGEELFHEWAQRYKTANNYVCLTASDHIPALEEFHQGALRLSQGRFPQAGESGACVVDGVTAAQMKLEVGSKLSLGILASPAEERFAVSETGEEKSLTVVGITLPSDDYAGHLWVSRAEGEFASPLFGYRLGEAVVENASARSAAEAIQALCPEGVRVTLYDQGYSASAAPLEAMESTALAVTLGSLCAALAVLFLFAFLFVGRQGETVEILRSLGTPKGKVRLWLLSGAGIIALSASLLGAVLGQALLSRTVEAALAAAQGLYTADLRYSEAALGVSLEGTGQTAIPLWPAAAAFLAVFLSALLLCAVFLLRAQRRLAPKRGKQTVRVPKGGTSVAGKGAARFALLSAKRGGWRSAVVPAAALALALLLGLLSGMARGRQGQMEELYDTAVLTGQVTSANGRQSTNLVVPAKEARRLWQSGMLGEIAVSLDWNYWLEEEMPVFVDSGFGAENRENWIARQPSLVALNSLEAAPAFYYSDDPGVEYLEGWDESFLRSGEYYSFLHSIAFGGGRAMVGGEEWLTYPCIAGKAFLEEHGLELGDVFTVQIPFSFLSQSWDMDVKLQVVGEYGQQGDAEIYVPLSFWCDESWITGEEDVLPEGSRVSSNFTDEAERDAYFYSLTNFSTCRFTLSSARDLEDFRAYLGSQSYSQTGLTGRNRTVILLRDRSFTETVMGLGRYLSFSELLFPALFATVILLGFVISWLMVNGRRMEFAILRGLGASKGRVFFSFFLEQGGLCLLGCLTGGAILTLGGTGWAGPAAAGGLLLCYLLGCALAVLAVGRTDLMALLSERE